MWNSEHEKTKALYFNIVNDSETFSSFNNTHPDDIISWEKYRARLYYLEEISDYVQVGPYANPAQE